MHKIQQTIRESKYIYFQTTQDQSAHINSFFKLPGKPKSDQEQLVSEQYYGVDQEIMVCDSIIHSKLAYALNVGR
jgi:hypothetical protein